MALTGIQIFKLLPKTNCKECGVPTCLAFAMNLASGKAELDSCPYVSAEARAALSEAAAPPIRPVALGKGVRATATGGETVQYRHEKTFFNPTLLAAAVGSDIAEAELATRLKTWNAFQYERVGLNLRPELVAVRDVNGNAEAFARTAKAIATTSEFNLILMTEKPAVMKAAVEAAGFKRPLLYAATAGNLAEMGALAKESGLPLAVKAASVADLVPLTTKLTEMGLKDLVLDPGSREPKQLHQDMIAIRRAALKDGNRALGFPTIVFPCEMAGSLEVETLVAGTFVAKYGGIAVMSDFAGESLFPLL
ncbi:MAG TPA: acetyl-CoA decarbonylase/synthase complex subunit gamma, partial [Desulfobacterales bacterium]|nr:acetyl-CoA decarbonylase/synthase complex subunit gamma [Desulfobacterales bacterium]